MPRRVKALVHLRLAGVSSAVPGFAGSNVRVSARWSSADQDRSQTLTDLALGQRIQSWALRGYQPQQPRGHHVNDAATHQRLDDLGLRIELPVLHQRRELLALLLDDAGQHLVEDGSARGRRVDDAHPGILSLLQNDPFLDQQVSDRRGAQRPPCLRAPACRAALVIGQQEEDLGSGFHACTIRAARSRHRSIADGRRQPATRRTRWHIAGPSHRICSLLDVINPRPDLHAPD